MEELMSKVDIGDRADRQHFIGGSDARVIMGGDETALIRLWQEKRGEAEPADLSGETSNRNSSNFTMPGRDL
jgi:predicted phage-related endonuclease